MRLQDENSNKKPLFSTSGVEKERFFYWIDFLSSPSEIDSVSHVRQQCHLTSTLDCRIQLTLMLRTGAGYSSGRDLATLADKLSQLSRILVVNKINLVCAENADFLSSSRHRTRSTRYGSGVDFNFIIHNDLQSSLSISFCASPHRRGLPQTVKKPENGYYRLQKGKSSSDFSSSNLGVSALLPEEKEGVVYASGVYDCPAPPSFLLSTNIASSTPTSVA